MDGCTNGGARCGRAGVLRRSSGPSGPCPAARAPRRAAGAAGGATRQRPDGCSSARRSATRPRATSEHGTPAAWLMRTAGREWPSPSCWYTAPTLPASSAWRWNCRTTSAGVWWPASFPGSIPASAGPVSCCWRSADGFSSTASPTIPTGGGSPHHWTNGTVDPDGETAHRCGLSCWSMAALTTVVPSESDRTCRTDAPMMQPSTW